MKHSNQFKYKFLNKHKRSIYFAKKTQHNKIYENTKSYIQITFKYMYSFASFQKKVLSNTRNTIYG